MTDGNNAIAARIDGDGPETRAATSTRARDLDQWQYEHGEGPCVRADVDLTVCAVDDLRDDDTFPQFAEVAMGTGVRSVASLPLLVRDERSVGSLNVFIGADRAFELLSSQSQHENRKVREIAAAMLEQHDRSVRAG